MSDLSWEYQDPNTYDEAERIKQLHAAAMLYAGASEAMPSQIVITTHTSKQRDLADGVQYPLTLDLLRLNVKYLSNPTGVWDIDNAPDTGMNHVRPNLYDVSHLDVSNDVLTMRSKYGVTTLMDFDPYTPFYPVFKNINAEVMLAPMYLSFASAAIVHMVHDNWKQRVGSNLTAEQYAARTIDYVNGEISKLFDNRYSYVVNSYETVADKKRRYSWTTEVTIGMPQAKWVNNLKIKVARTQV